MDSFITGEKYKRSDIYQIKKVPKERQHGKWETGYNEYDGEFFIFVTIGTDTNYNESHQNYWSGDLLIWHGRKNSHINQPSIKRMLDPTITKHIFTRKHKNDPFIYQGIGIIDSYKDTTPILIKWKFNKSNNNYSNEESNDTFNEGATHYVTINKYERNPKAREKCLKHYGYTCQICGFNFEEAYGPYGKGVIEVHHIVPISSIKKEYILDPIKDLIPVCPNCHTIIHKNEETLKPDDVRKLIKESQKRRNNK